MKEGIPLPVRIVVKPDRTFRLDIRLPTVSYFLKAAAGIEKGAGRTGEGGAGGAGGGGGSEPTTLARRPGT
uniref:Uncharacterized protein n=1 Tax=Callorhinchus milii TaxID=7868 RepID=A0A4W3GCH4_CALMI